MAWTFACARSLSHPISASIVARTAGESRAQMVDPHERTPNTQVSARWKCLSVGGGRMRRRVIVAGFTGIAVLSMRPGARAQQAPRRIARVAILSPGASEARSVLTAFRTRLCELGYVEGRDVALEFHFANGSERLAALAQAIVRDGPDLVLADGRLAAQAMRAASRTIPIVAITGEPVTFGLAESLARPGGNVTGIATMSAELGAKQLELLREILPRARRIGVVDASISAVSYRAFEGRAARPSAMSTVSSCRRAHRWSD
ncbi:MAG TPA: ABC transporter substrate binding protein [Caldimonas sp.]